MRALVAAAILAACAPAPRAPVVLEGHAPAVAPRPCRELRARTINVSVSGADTRITMNRGAEDGVAPGWTGQVLDDRGQPIRGGDFVVDRVTPTASVASLRLTMDIVGLMQVVLREPCDQGTRPANAGSAASTGRSRSTRCDGPAASARTNRVT
jgi:hypothetical protein